MLYAHFVFSAMDVPSFMVLLLRILLSFFPVGDYCIFVSFYITISVIMRFLYTCYISPVSMFCTSESTASLVLSVSTSIGDIVEFLSPYPRLILSLLVFFLRHPFLYPLMRFPLICPILILPIAFPISIFIFE